MTGDQKSREKGNRRADLVQSKRSAKNVKNEIKIKRPDLTIII